MKMWKFLNFITNRRREAIQLLALTMSIGFTSELSATVIHADGTKTEYGVVSRRVVTTVGATYLATAFTGSGAASNINWHLSGTGTGAESITDTALGTPIGSTRVAGTQSNPSGQVYQSQATLSYTTTNAVTEHGIWTASTSGTLWDRSVFSAINVINGDSIQFTYQLTINSGG